VSEPLLLICGTCGVWVVEHQARVVAAGEPWAGQNVCQRCELLAMLKRMVDCRSDLMARMTVMSDAWALVKRIEGA
jgi:hypothetical protein